MTSGPATISGNTVTITGVGPVVLGASQAASINYTAATASTSFTVNAETPTLVFAAIPSHTYGDAPFTVSATSASSGAVTYSVTSGPATISGNTVTIPYTTWLRYDQPGYTTYDGSLGVAKDNWTAEFFGQNLSNSDASTFTSSAQFIKAEVPLRPRVLGVKFGYKF